MKTKRVLLLNASEEVLDIITWQKAVTLMMQGKASRPHGYDDEYEIQTVSGVFRLPTAIVLVSYVRIPYKRAAVNKQNVLRRDSYKCVYCGKKLTNTSGTIDHVQPTSKGGQHDWRNVVSACKPCNGKKDNRTPHEAGMKLLSQPFVPTRNIIVLQGIDTKTKKSWTRWFAL